MAAAAHSSPAATGGPERQTDGVSRGGGLGDDFLGEDLAVGDLAGDRFGGAAGVAAGFLLGFRPGEFRARIAGRHGAAEAEDGGGTY